MAQLAFFWVLCSGFLIKNNFYFWRFGLRPPPAMDCRGNMYRIRECACDLLLCMEDDLMVGDGGGGDEDADAWELMGRDLRLKSTFLFCDLHRLISAAGDGELKQSLTALANRLFHHMEELGRAIKSRSVPQAQHCYGEAAMVLQEVVAAMVPSH